MSDLKRPTVEAVLAINVEVPAAHGGSPGLHSRELLELAVAAPQATLMGRPLMTDRYEIAAACLYCLCGSHALVDGNKRVALATSLVFLSGNGLLPDERLDADAWENLTLDVAAGKLARDETTKRLRKLVK
jgi:death-on-curing protein